MQDGDRYMSTIDVRLGVLRLSDVLPSDLPGFASSQTAETSVDSTREICNLGILSCLGNAIPGLLVPKRENPGVSGCP